MKRISCLICKVIEEKHSVQENKTMIIDKVYGIWRDRDVDVENYILEMRINRSRNGLNVKHYPLLSSQYFI